MKINKGLYFLLVPLQLSSCSNNEQQPNFVFILVDDLGWADVKCNYPQSFYDTPNIDQLAENGVRFTQAYAAHSVCSPTRAAIMTGKHPNRVGITDWIPGVNPKDRFLLGPDISNELALEEITIAEKLKEKAYKTCFIGKWHLGDDGYLPEDQGFDINIGGHHWGSPPGGYYSPYKNPKISDGPDGEYLPNRLTDESIQFINANKEYPFFLYLAFYTVHTPIQAAETFVDKYREKRKELNIDEVPHKTEGEATTKLLQEDPDYASMVEAMDHNVGRIVQSLKENGLDKNTWIIFTSDNGGLSTWLRKQSAPTSNDPLRAGKGWCYEGGIRVPLIISGPQLTQKGRVVDDMVISMDFFTTLLNLAGVEHHANDGISLLPLLTEGKRLERDEQFWHYPHYHGSGWKPGSALRKGNWKLIVHYEDEKVELFDLSTDPGEKTDVAENFPEKLNDLKTMLDEKLEESGGKLPEYNPDFPIRNNPGLSPGNSMKINN